MRRALVLAALVALAAPAASLAAPRDVSVPARVFFPKTINVVVNDSVRWTNHTGEDHVVDSTDPPFSAVLQPHGQAGSTYESPGFPTERTGANAVKYVCTIHPNMVGTIAVWNVWLGTPGLLTAGQTAKFSGLAPAGATVQLQTSTGTSVGASTTADALTGAYSISVPSAAPGKFKVHNESAATDSRVVTLSVKPKLTITKRKVRRGVWSVVVKAAPNQKGATAIVDKKKGFGWAKLASKSFGPVSKAGFTVRIPKTKSQLRVRVRLTHPKNGYSPATTASFVLKR